MATLIVVRHGESGGNAEHRFIGHTQVSLTERGHFQAKRLAQRLVDEPITRIVASDLIRCVETATPLAETLGLDVETTPALREVDNGDWTGLLPTEIAARWPEIWNDYVAGVDVARPGGERWADVARRVIPVAEQLLNEAGVVVVATHSGPALLLAMWAMGMKVQENIYAGRFGALHNTALTVIGPGPRLISYNDVGHLAALPDQRLPFAAVTPT